MNYEEKRELRLQISQLLADAGLNQKTIKDMVVSEIRNKVDKAVDQAIISLNANSRTGDFAKEEIRRYFDNTYSIKSMMEHVIKEEIKNRVINVQFDPTIMVGYLESKGDNL